MRISLSKLLFCIATLLISSESFAQQVCSVVFENLNSQLEACNRDKFRAEEKVLVTQRFLIGLSSLTSSAVNEIQQLRINSVQATVNNLSRIFASSLVCAEKQRQAGLMVERVSISYYNQLGFMLTNLKYNLEVRAATAATQFNPPSDTAYIRFLGTLDLSPVSVKYALPVIQLPVCQ